MNVNSCGWVYLNELLDHTYPIRIFCDEHEIIEDLIEDELALGLIGEGAENLLHHMGPLKILSQLHYMTLQCLGDQVLLCRPVDQVEHELDRVCALLIAADLDEVVLDYS